MVLWLGECPLTVNPANNMLAVMRHVGTVEQPYDEFFGIPEKLI